MIMKLILAHRGASRLAHENTIEAFRKAVEIGADVIELDVRKTADGVLVIFHDDEIDGYKIKSLSFEQLNSIARTKNFIVPTLQQALEAGGKLKFQIEVKELGDEYKTVETALKVLSLEQFSIISFKLQVLQNIRAKCPDVTLGLIVGSRPLPLFALANFWLRRGKIFSTVNAFSLNWQLLNVGLDRLIPASYPITVWNLDDDNSIKKFLKHPRVSILGSNRPELAMIIKNQLT